MTLLEALRLMRRLEPVDPEDPQLIEATGVVAAEVRRLAPRIFPRDQAEDAAQRVLLKLFRDATLRRSGREFAGESDAIARGFLRRALLRRRIDQLRRAKRLQAKSLTGADGGDIDVGDAPLDPELERELSDALRQFEKALPHEIASAMSTKAASTFLEVLDQLRALRDDNIAMDDLVEEELADEPVERGTPVWKTARNRLYRRMKRCRDTIAEEIVVRCDAGAIDMDRAALLFLCLDQLQFRQTDEQQKRRSMSDPRREDVS